MEAKELKQKYKELKQNYDTACQMNIKWQIYDSSRDRYVSELHATIIKLSNQLTELKKDQIAFSCGLDAKLARKTKEIASLTDRNEYLEAQIASMKKSESERQHRSKEQIMLYGKQVYL